MAKWDKNAIPRLLSWKRSSSPHPSWKHPYWPSPLRCHIDASQLAAGVTLTQVTDAGDHAFSYFSKRLSTAEEIYSANVRELLGLIYFLQHFLCYLESNIFEVLTDNQVLWNFFNKPSLSCWEPRWLDFLRQFGISEPTLVERIVHVLCDALPSAPHIDRNNNELSGTTSHSIIIDPRLAWLPTTKPTNFSNPTSKPSRESFRMITPNRSEQCVSF